MVSPNISLKSIALTMSVYENEFIVTASISLKQESLPLQPATWFLHSFSFWPGYFDEDFLAIPLNHFVLENVVNLEKKDDRVAHCDKVGDMVVLTEKCSWWRTGLLFTAFFGNTGWKLPAKYLRNKQILYVFLSIGLSSLRASCKNLMYLQPWSYKWMVKNKIKSRL